MTTSYKAIAISAVVFLTGCALEEDAHDSTDELGSHENASVTDPNQTFKTQVKPITDPYCLPCHGASLPPNLTSYATLAGKYRVKPGATNPLITKSAHEGPAFTAAQRTAIINWIDSLPTPAQSYETEVKPIVSAECMACHNSNSLPPNFTSYATLAARYKAKPGATNPLITKSVHAGPAFTAAQRTTIINWIDSQP